MSKFKNFAMMIPLDIERHPDGTPKTGFKNDEQKEACRLWLISNGLTEEKFQSLSGKEKEKLFRQFRELNP